MMSWLNVHSHCLTFLGGVPKLLIPDNLRSAVKKADRYEPVINDSYLALAEHYGTVIIPARPRKPKDKPKAENGVLIVEQWLLARIRNETFHTLKALNARLRELLTDMNNRPMKRGTAIKPAQNASVCWMRQHSLHCLWRLMNTRNTKL